MEAKLQQRTAAVGALTLLGVAAVVPPQAALWVRALAPAVAILWAGRALRHPGPGSAVAVLAAALAAIAASGVVWQAAMPVALGVFFLASRLWPGLGSVRQPAGEVPRWPTVVCAAVTPVALLMWLALFRPDLSDITDAVPKLSRTVLVLGGIAFALVNALGEEWIWRGIIQTRLTAMFPVRLAIAVQALSFGVQHAHGFPRGVAGVVLASIWAVMLGLLRQHSRGLLAPTLAHVVADATIAVVVISLLR